MLAVIACLAGCVGDPDVATVGDREPLAVLDWSSPSLVASGSYFDVSIAYLDTTAYAAFSSNGTVYFSRLSDGTWTAPAVVPGVTTWAGTALAGFNGRLYLLTVVPSTNKVEMSRYDPATQTWSTGSQLPFPSVWVPALAVHQSRLYLLGTDPTSLAQPIWISSMAADGSFAPQQITPLRGGGASAASFRGDLHVAYTDATTVEVRHAVLHGTTWGTPEAIPMGTGSSKLRGAVAVARYAGGPNDCLHLAAVQSVQEASVWWTYICGSSTTFAVPVTIPTARALLPSLAGGPRLLLAYRHISQGNALTQSYAYPDATCGVCTPGQVQSCGLCGTQTCTASCTWGACVNQGVCAPGQTVLAQCGNCGTRIDTCAPTCQWIPGFCGGEGECAPGDFMGCCPCGFRDCACSGEAICGGDCHWGSCQEYVCGTGECQ